MTTVAQVSEAMQRLLTEVANAAGVSSGLVQRQRKLSGATFVQTLVFGWMANPQASIEELSQSAATCGVKISPQGLDQRFTVQASECLRQVLERSIGMLLEAGAGPVGWLGRFRGVYLLDSTVVGLPASLQSLWTGCGNQTGGSAGMKIQTILEYQRGRLEFSLQPARQNDRLGQREDFPEGALRLADSGFFDLKHFQRLGQRGVGWLTRVPAHVRLWDEGGACWTLAAWLAAQTGATVDQEVGLGSPHMRVRLLAERVPETVAQQRRARLLQDAQRRRRKVSELALTLAAWTLLATNLTADQLTVTEAVTLMRLRWQIELLFKLWKSHGQLDTWRSQQPWRVLCEVYAKLLMLMVQHWILLLGCWSDLDRSLFKAAQTIRKHAFHLASVLSDRFRLMLALQTICQALAAGCRVQRRQARPATFQLLESLSFA
jgi:hypothetical protein